MIPRLVLDASACAALVSEIDAGLRAALVSGLGLDDSLITDPGQDTGLAAGPYHGVGLGTSLGNSLVSG